ncbi:hypothetical protein [Mesorhizobium sp. M1A.F.Ca.ET.072.01.1.1]|nr:hypothetical protein [Mesorhizobium sp. M1A.F.Ca.ET.072.01.1.1]
MVITRHNLFKVGIADETALSIPSVLPAQTAPSRRTEGPRNEVTEG